MERAVILSRGASLKFQLQESAPNSLRQAVPLPKAMVESQRASIKAALREMKWENLWKKWYGRIAWFASHYFIVADRGLKNQS